MKFSEIIGNDEIKNYLLNSVKNNTLSQSYLFSGTDGIGKLIMAKEFAKKILCLSDEKKDECDCKSCKCFEGGNHIDYTLINEAGETIKIDQIREMTNKIIEQPIISDRKVYIINDCDKMTVDAQNCLLKTLEEPPQFAVIILISSNENVILNTIKSRCMIIKFKNISNNSLKKYAIENLGYNGITENFLKSLNGSIGQAIIQKENQEKFLSVENFVNDLSSKDIISLMNDAKIIYDKEKIYKILEYMIICMYAMAQKDIRYINCIEKINKCMMNLKRNCNFDMSIDTMVFSIYECVNT